MPPLRSGLLAAWASAWLAGEVAYDEVIDVVTGADEPHRVAGLPGAAPLPQAPGEPADAPLGWLLSELRNRGVTAARLVLPVPGDPRGLPGPSPFTAAAIDAREAVVAGGLGVVPTVTRHGSAVGSATHSVRWTVHRIGEQAPDPLTLGEARHDLELALRESTVALAEVDAASWRPGVGEDVARLRQQHTPRLPPASDPRAVQLLVQADRLATILALADADAPGGAVSGAQARARAEALRPLRTAVRRARLAAYNAAPAVPR